VNKMAKHTIHNIKEQFI